MTLHVAVDFGTSSTCVAVSVDGREPQVVMVDGGSPVMPSAVYAAADGLVFVGQEAERQAAIDPSRYEPHPKRRIDEGQLLLGNTVVDVLDVVRSVLSRAVTEARRFAGDAPVDLLVLTHPADWGALRTRVLRQAASGLANTVSLVPEPVAAAVFHAAGHDLAETASLAVLDLGGGTVDVSVVRRDQSAAPAGFRVLATHGDPNFGGADIDQLLLEHVGRQIPEDEREQWRALMEGREMTDRRRRRVLRQDVRGAKETLSRHAYTDVPLPPPFADAHVTRDDLEKLIAEPLRRAATLTLDAVTEAGLRPTQLAGLFLVGGSSRIPLVARLLTECTGIIPTTLDQPETVVARGALRAMMPHQRRTGGPVAGHNGTRPPVPGSLPGALPGSVPPMAQAATVGRNPGVRPGFAAPSAGRPPGYPSGAMAPPAPPLPRTPPPPPRNGAAPSFAPGGQNEVTQRIPVAPKPNTTPAARPPARRRTSVWLVSGGVLVVVAAVILFVTISQPGVGKSATPGPAPTPAPTSAPAYLAQYDYRFPLPDGWSQAGSDPSNRGTGITPQNAPSSYDEIYVEEFLLDNDATANRSVTVDDLRKKVQGAGGQGFDASARYAGRTVVAYQLAGNGFVVDWYVLFQGKIQVSVGCQYPPGTKSNIDSACQQVVSGTAIRGTG
ncbi:MAG TPA: type VII secretion-associated protein [Pseudonocardiaceae bacterium]|nr:type VII secretion-associated protein [Pseudonocardiaceae bacterium]